MKNISIFLLITIVVLFSCKKNDDSNPVSAGTSYSNGVFIVNEGTFGSGTGTISFYNRYSKTVTTDIFQKANGFPVGNVAQSINVFNDRAYIVVNNAQKVEVTNLSDFKSTGTITGLSQPRYFLGINSSKAYVTEWVDGSQGKIAVINLNNPGITKTIVTGVGAEQMIMSGNDVYVCNAGGYDASFNSINDSNITVVNSLTDSVVAKIYTGAYNPSAIVKDLNGKIWVLCAGTFTGYAAHLVRIDPNTKTVELNFTLGASFANKMSINKDQTKLYYILDGKVFGQEVNATTLNAVPVISRNFYGIGIDPSNGYIYCSDAKDFSSNGWVIRYMQNGSVVDSFEVGVNPGNFFFN